jgi:hypothetical protein
LRPVEIEEWVLRVVDQLRRGTRVEDARVELKSEWLDPKRAARRIAGHANAARGSTILWIIGIDDEDAEIVGVASSEFLEWWEQVRAEFNELAPSVIDLVVPLEDKDVVALAFDTSRVPLVVKNSVYGIKGGGSVSLEVPWREGTSTRSATRADLIALLVPTLTIPQFHVLSGSLKAEKARARGRGLQWTLQLDVYIDSVIGSPVVIPDYQCRCSVKLLPKSEMFQFTDVKVLSRESAVAISGEDRYERSNVRHTIQRGVDQIIIEGPGPAMIIASAEISQNNEEELSDVPIVSLDASLKPVSAAHSVPLAVSLSREVDKFDWDRSLQSTIATWRYKSA